MSSQSTKLKISYKPPVENAARQRNAQTGPPGKGKNLGIHGRQARAG